uniref:Uncharacterized protein n=1 Tax=Arundo donax TaxID=35708 RepID=A0A0A9B441_ARUDO
MIPRHFEFRQTKGAPETKTSEWARRTSAQHIACTLRPMHALTHGPARTHTRTGRRVTRHRHHARVTGAGAGRRVGARRPTPALPR